MKMERETIQYEIGSSWYQWNIISSKEDNDISYHEIHAGKEKKNIYIYIYDNEDWARHNQIWDWQLHDINEIIYRQKKKKMIFHIVRCIQNSKIDLYIYIYENEDWERDKQMWDWQFHDINEILYR